MQRHASRHFGLRLIGALFAASALVGVANAKVFNWANDGDANSMDPYARNETFLLTFTLNIYEPLVRRSPDLKTQASLATEWSQTAPDVWRFKLRANVKFHDGTPFTADDVVFSHKRATSGGSNIKGYFASVKEVRKVDDLTVEIVTAGPNPILVDELTNWAIMSKSWAEKNNATVAADLTKNEESFATRNANGTGPFILKSREADVKTVLVPNPNWWDRPEHNITEANFFRIGNDATRIAALLSGQVDFVYTVPPQDMERIGRTPGLKLAQGPELRTIYLGMDVLRDELTESNVKGKNPLKDRRVRQAFYQAIDVEVMRTRVMRGQSNPTALMVGPGVNGFDAALNQRQSPYDPEAAKKLLADAGYPNGFEIGMDCPNDRYVNDEQICQAVAAMLARIGIKVNLNAQTRARFFAKINVPRFETPFYLIGWTPATYDVHNALLNLLHTRQLDRGRGMFNVGGYSNAAVDRLTDEIAAEINPQKRAALIEQVTRLVKEDYATIPLHQQTVVWAMKQSVDVKQYADNSFPLRLVQVK